MIETSIFPLVHGNENIICPHCKKYKDGDEVQKWTVKKT
jgi:hypothetical protein